ncbi:hypothetical protein ACFXDJ_19675 [Streptomyces sp. NPDC059443]
MPRKPLTRREHLALARATLAGLASGTARAVTSWLLNQLAP